MLNTDKTEIVEPPKAVVGDGVDDSDKAADEEISERLKLSKASERAKKFWNESFSKKTDRGFVNKSHMENHPDDTTYHIPKRVLEREAKREKQPAVSYVISQGEQSQTRDWLTSYESFKDILHKLAPQESNPSILVIGNGLSYLPIELYKDGYHDVWGTDIADVAIDKMREETQGEFPGIKWEVADIFSMPNIPSGHFDVVLDKAVLDSVLFRQPSKIRPKIGKVALAEISRVLKVTGIYFIVSPRRKISSDLPAIKEWTRIEFVSMDQEGSDHISVVSGKCTDFRENIYVQVFKNPADEKRI